MIISAYNPKTTELEKTYLSSSVQFDDVNLPVKNNEKFVIGDKVLVGEMGGEQSEIRTASAVAASGLQVTVDALDFDHDSDTPIYKLDFDQINFYRRVSIAASPTLMATLDIDVDNADKITRWDDTTSSTAYFYQTSFYNSVTDEETDLSDPIQATGYERKTAGAIIDAVVRRVRDTGFNVLGFEEYIDIMNEVGDDLTNQALRPYTFLKKSVPLNTAANTNYIDLDTAATDFWKFDYVEIDQNTTGVPANYKEVTPLSLEGFNQRYNNGALLKSDIVRDVAFDDETKRLYIYPTPSNARTGKVILHYYKTFTQLEKAGDLIETPLPNIYRYKLMAEYYSAKSESDKQWERLATKYEEKYGNEVVKMQRVNRLDVGTPRSFRPPRAYRRRRYTL
jgi:hypothetical protein